MILLQANNLTKSFGIDTVFDKVSFQIAPGDKIGLVGPNGAGKTTLLRCITGEEAPDCGTVIRADGLKAGYLEQVLEYPAGTTLFEMVMAVFADLIELRNQLARLEQAMGDPEQPDLAKLMDNYARLTEQYERAEGFSCESKVRKVAAGLGFSEADLGRELRSFSGGERTRAGLVRLLVREPDLLFLDEPTNHLDLTSVEWLEGYLHAYQGAVLLISHDRYFLDAVTVRTLELEHHHLTDYPGNYSRYLKLKREREAALAEAYRQQQKMIKATEEYINKYRAGIKSKQARGRQSQLDRLERIAAPETSATIHLGSDLHKVDSSGNMVLEGTDLDLNRDGKVLLAGVNIKLMQGEKVAIIGENGVGKSSLLKVITGQFLPQAGAVRLGSRVMLGYFDQEHAGLNKNNSVLAELVYDLGLREEEARNYLGALLFRGDDVLKTVSDLSGGEKGRLSFLKVILKQPNFLILDEPTNHLDIPSKQIIEGFLQEFQGTVLMVSHDRYFLDQIVDRTLELANGHLTEYLGNYSYYKEKKAQLNKAQEQPETQTRVKHNHPQTNGTPKINKAKIRAQISQLETDIEKMEEQLADLSERLADSSTYHDEEKAKTMVNEYKLLEEKIPQAYTAWEELAKKLEG
ncbi:MAG TPA: ABC-F family ATP-binding cassette domain-containing protein [Desulfobacteria bacterium]|nr:ABC-F family ATP-binding cassette domain-containing protein [Desulfobacteria bacterium]